ncbi:MAG: potassium channel family protein [Acidimicrobiaceae bacterium]|jgi:uncharacterized membrane protein|nr:potassium channel family protein [Acidimicrobiaceae bacterium]
MAERPLAPNAPGVERLLALSDGVVAIALTLLVLSLHVPNLPHSHNNAISADWLAHQLRALSDPLISYVVAFYVICQFWLAHHRAFRLMAGHDEGLAWWNFFFLFTLTLLPFTSNLLGQFGSNPLAVDIFSINLILASVSTFTVVTVAQRRGLLVPWAERQAIRSGRLRTLGVVMVVAISIVVATYNTEAAKYVWLLIAVVPHSLTRWFDTYRPIEPGTLVRVPASPADAPDPEGTA